MIDLNIIREFVCQAHVGQLYGSSDYYSGHLLNVAVLVDNEAEKQEISTDLRFILMATALLHDCLEDTHKNVKDVYDVLTLAGFNGEERDYIVKALLYLTKAAGEEYNTYIDNLLENHIARRVKKADANANMNSCIADGDFSRAKKYLKVLCRIIEYENTGE